MAERMNKVKSKEKKFNSLHYLVILYNSVLVEQCNMPNRLDFELSQQIYMVDTRRGWHLLHLQPPKQPLVKCHLLTGDWPVHTLQTLLQLQDKNFKNTSKTNLPNV